MNEKQYKVKTILPVVLIQFLSGFNENVLRSVFIVSIAFSVMHSASAHHDALVNLVNVLVSLPIILFSSYAGKIADTYNKVAVIRGISLYQFIIAYATAICIVQNWENMLILLLFLVGLQQTCLYSVRFSILAEYLNTTEQIGLATSYIEAAWIMSTLAGQVFGTWAISSHKINVLITTIIVCGGLSLIASFVLKPVNKSIITNIATKKFYWNPFKDAWLVFKQVSKNRLILLNMNAIGWLAILGTINTTQMALFVANYLGADGHIFGIVMAFGTVGIGAGSVICAKLTKGVIKRKTLVITALIISGVNISLLLLHSHIIITKIPCKDFILSLSGFIVFVLVFIKSISFGFYTLTSYTEAQILTTTDNRSQVMSVISILIALYVIIGSSICYVLQHFLTSWEILFSASIINILLALLYWRKVRALPPLSGVIPA